MLSFLVRPPRLPNSVWLLEEEKMGEAKEDQVFASIRSIIFKESVSLEGKCVKIVGYDFNQV
ncbi:deoxyhypusine synthase isoform X1 [Senna tora]|uniref:Deoxyhypusine synthase isoform X1 n=1 Tax=Senna tora TaxID=362788 RepID=A0A834X839_9FABA|nr:deoxyhypusine synthase isoform X1 [Senna tora]